MPSIESNAEAKVQNPLCSISPGFPVLPEVKVTNIVLSGAHYLQSWLGCCWITIELEKPGHKWWWN
jgi:hypothetical protein